MKNIRVLAAFAAGLLTALGVGVAIGAQSETSQGGGQPATFAALNGSKEIGNDGQKGAGDANGRGSFSAILDGRQLCYGLTVANIGKPIAAHIHKAARGENGDVVQTLKHPKAGDPGASSQCIQISRFAGRRPARQPEGLLRERAQREVPGGSDPGPALQQS